METLGINSVNSFQTFIFWFFGVIGYILVRALCWVMPKTANLILIGIKDWLTKDLKDQLNCVNEKLENYKKEKHDVASELNILRGAVIFDDQEFLEIYKKKYMNLNKNEKE